MKNDVRPLSVKQLLIFALAAGLSASISTRVRAAGGMDVNPEDMGAEQAAMPSIPAWTFPASVAPASEDVYSGMIWLEPEDVPPPMRRALFHMTHTGPVSPPVSRAIMGVWLKGVPQDTLEALMEAGRKAPLNHGNVRWPANLRSVLRSAYERNAPKLKQMIDARAAQLALAVAHSGGLSAAERASLIEHLLPASMELEEFSSISERAAQTDGMVFKMRREEGVQTAQRMAQELLAGIQQDYGAPATNVAPSQGSKSEAEVSPPLQLTPYKPDLINRRFMQERAPLEEKDGRYGLMTKLAETDPYLLLPTPPSQHVLIDDIKNLPANHKTASSPKTWLLVSGLSAAAAGIIAATLGATVAQVFVLSAAAGTAALLILLSL